MWRGKQDRTWRWWQEQAAETASRRNVVCQCMRASLPSHFQIRSSVSPALGPHAQYWRGRMLKAACPHPGQRDLEAEHAAHCLLCWQPGLLFRWACLQQLQPVRLRRQSCRLPGVAKTLSRLRPTTHVETAQHSRCPRTSPLMIPETHLEKTSGWMKKGAARKANAHWLSCSSVVRYIVRGCGQTGSVCAHGRHMNTTHGDPL